MSIKEDSGGMGGREAGAEAPTLFLRKATGLVRGWSVRDAIIYACLSTNIITLGILIAVNSQVLFPAETARASSQEQLRTNIASICKRSTI